MRNDNGISTDRKLTKRVIFSYGLPRSCVTMMLISVSIYLPKFYTDTLLLAPALIGWTFMIGRFWDGITDPLMGYFSDRTQSKLGRRRPYLLMAAIPIGIGYYFLWAPPQGLGGQGLFIYVTAVYLVTFTFWTMFSIPHTSLGAELTMDYHERTVLTGVREALGALGTLLGTAAPAIVGIFILNKQTVYSSVAAVVGCLTVVFILICFFNVKENPKFQKKHPLPFKESLAVMAGNRPFRVLVLLVMMCYVGYAFVPILTLYVGDYVVKVPKVASLVIITYLLFTVISIAFWAKLSKRIGKKKTLARGLLLSSVAFALTTYYHEGTWLAWIILAAATGTGYGCLLAIAPSMMADVVDLDELNTGKRREGAYFGVWHFIDKAAVGLTTFTGLQVLDMLGYVPNQEQSLSVIWGMKVLYCILPAICIGAGFIVLRYFPIDEQEHQRIRDEIEARNAETAVPAD
ncbi:MAG: MFS transporter [Desulfobacterales bacterium]|nr:MFS transporter [Desulfobacterales bacterium]